MKSYYFKFMLVLIASAGLALTSCKKGTTAIDDSISAQDANNVTNTIHTTTDDAAAAAGQVSSYKSLGLGQNWNTGGGNLLVGATITDTASTGIIITYDGTTPWNGIIRSGTITIINASGTPWHLQNSTLTITYDLTATEQSSGYTYKLTGTHTVLNETGGLAWQVVAGLAPTALTPTTTVTHRITSSNMQVTFPNNTTRTWTVDRTRSWSYSNSVLTVSVYSEHSGGVAEQGTNRFGDAFTNTFIDTVSANNNTCEKWRPYTGTWQHQVSTRTATVAFGTNPSGIHIGTPSYCATLGNLATYGYYITYTNGSRTLNRFVSYW
jgi:hypothetical protein